MPLLKEKDRKDVSGEYVQTELVVDERGSGGHYLLVVLRPDQITQIAAAVVEALAKTPRP